MLSFLKMLQNWPKHGSEFGVLLWRHLMPQRKTVIWVHNYTPLVYNCHKLFWKIYFLCDIWCAKSCSFRAIFGLPSRCLTLAVGAMYRRAEIFLYRCTSTFSPLNHCGGILLKYFCYTRSGVHKFFRRFFDFSQFLFAILRKLWRHLATRMRTHYCFWN